MKKYFAIITLAFSTAVMAQQLPASLSSAVNTLKQDTALKPQLSPDLSYYSKNYTTVFGQYQYTLNSTAFSNTKNIYVASDDKFYILEGSKFISGMPFAGDTVLPYTYGKGAFVSGVISMLLGENLTNLEKFLSWKTPK